MSDPAALEQLTRVAGRVLLGAEVRTARAEDGSYIYYMLPHIGLATDRKTEAPRSWRDGNGPRPSKRIQFYVGREDRT